MQRAYLYLLLFFIGSCVNKPEVENQKQLKVEPAAGSVTSVTKQASDDVLDSARTGRSKEFTLKLQSIKSMKVLTSVKHNDTLASTGENFYDQCDRWNLSPQQIEMISKASTAIGAMEWHYRYSVLPCYYEGNAIVNGLAVSYSIHSGSYLMVSSPDTTIYFGYIGQKFKKLFLDDPMAGDDE